jgi:hypothetical protein
VTRIHLFSLCVCLVLTAQASTQRSAGAATAAPKPRIDAITPSSGSTSSPVTISGKGFGKQGTVTFSNNAVVPASAAKWSDTAITVSVPQKAVTGGVIVTAPGGTSNTVGFVVSPKKSHPETPPALLPLGALSGSDADLLAQTLSSVFHGRLVVTACNTKSGDGGGQGSSGSGSPGSGSSGGSKDALQIKDSGVAPAPSTSTSNCSPTTTKGSSAASVPNCTAANTPRCVLRGIEASLDRDNFNGGILNSNYVVYVKGFAAELATAFPHPTSDIDVEQAVDSVGTGKSGDYLILVPSSSVVKQSGAAKNLAQNAAGLKRDFELLFKYASNGGSPQGCPNLPGNVPATELCFSKNTFMLSVLDPRDVALQAPALFNAAEFDVEVFPLNRSISLVPKTLGRAGSTAQASAIEQYELYKQNQKQAQVLASVQSTAPPLNPTPPSAPVTTTTTTIKTPVSAPSKVTTPSGVGSTTPAAGTTTISTSTSTSSTPPVAGASAPAQAPPPPTTAPSISSTPPPPATAVAQAQTSSPPPWGIDNIVRLYDYRDAPGIAAAINAMAGSHPIVQPLSDNNANDLIEVFPGVAQQAGYSIGDIERAISLLDLPRPQLSLQVWSYQISAKVDNPNEPGRNNDGQCPKTKDSKLCSKKNGECVKSSDSYPCYTGDCEKDNSRRPCPKDTGKRAQDYARITLERVNRRVDKANERMAKALESGMDAIFQEARTDDCSTAEGSSSDTVDLWVKWHDEKHPPRHCLQIPKHKFFQEAFRGYLTAKYNDCVSRDRYCIGYYNALDYPDQGSSGHVANPSLGRLILFLAATDESEAKELKDNIIKSMRVALVDEPCPSSSCVADDRPHLYFSRFCDELDRATEPGNLHILRAAFLDFFFNYKWTINYPNDFVPYDLRRSAHTLDDLLQPIVNAFNQDIDEYVQDKLDDPSLTPRTSRVGLVSQGMVQVAALSGSSAMVSGQISDFFDITKTPALSEVAQNLLAQPGSSQTGGSPSLQGLISTNPYVVGGEALASMLAPQKLTAQLTKGITLIVTPTSLDTASSAELTVSLSVNEPDGGPQSVNSTAVTQDLLDRVSSHLVTDTVRVQSLKLFDLSTVSMEITHPQTPTCLPLAYDGFWRAASYVAAVPFSVPCAVWRSTFGSMPVAGRLFEWPRRPVTVDNRSLAIIRATVVPTAMDLGEALDFESDRVYDPVTNLTESLSSVSQLGWKARQFHRLMMQCMLNPDATPCPTLSTVPDDVRKPSTN